MTSRCLARRIVLGLLTVAALCSNALAAAQPPPGGPIDPASPENADVRPSVLVLIPVQPGRLVFDRLTQGVLDGFLKAPGAPVNVFVEYLYDLAAPAGTPDHQLEFLRAKYASTAVDLVIAFQDPAYFAIRGPLGLRPDVPIVFGSLDPIDRPSGTALIRVGGDEGDSLAKVAPLLPAVDRIVFVGGGTVGDRLLNAGLTDKLERVAPGRVIDLTQVPLRDLPERLTSLSERSVIVLGTILGDSTGHPVTAPMLMKVVGSTVRVPVVVGHDLLFGHGVLGGWVYSFEELGRETASVAVAILGGTPVDEVPTRVLPTRPTFDARQLRRFGIDEARLPSDAQVLFREPTRWEAYRPWLIFSASALALQSALIFGLVEERRRRRESDGQLASRSVRQSLIADVSSEFANLTHGDVDAAIDASLKEVGSVLGVNECAVWAVDGQRQPCLVSRWQASPETATRLGEARMASAAARVLDDEIVHIDAAPAPPDRPDAASASSTLVLLPLRVDGRVMGILAIDHGRTSAWSRQVADDLRTVGEILATAVVRKRTDASMRTQLEALAHVNRVAGLGELAASLAHQLNQPLAAILSNAEVAQHLLDGPDPPIADVREILTDVIADDERAGGIISHMRTMLKKQHVEATMVDVNAMVARVNSLAAHDARLRGSSLHLDLGNGLPRVHMDPTQLKQVILNVVVNATDAMAAVLCRTPVQLRTRARDGGVLIETRDRGPGIPDEAMRHLFDPFFTTKVDGLGVGLSIARSIVEAAGGRISAHNDAAGGAVFRIWLPAGTDRAD